MYLEKKKRNKALAVMAVLLVLSAGGIVATMHTGKHESIKETMRDAVLHDLNRISVFGLFEADPSLVSGFIVTALMLFIALILRIFVIPRFKRVPGRFQMLIELWVDTFRNLAKGNSPHRYKALGAYIFAVGSYIFTGTMFELFGFQAITSEGHSISLPAPLANINGAIATGCFSYLFIMFGGITANKIKGAGKTLKEFSLPVSMTFRLFGALLSGMLTTELVYYYITLSFVLPVVVGVLFTVLHAVIQAYVLTMLTSFYYGEVTEPIHKKEKKTQQEGRS
ncbi:MAG: F0F1 ATP synthase subunit A [Lachnospiraceae bacterium]|nr:F0F1 ATP synthase subunit A [Lachnospiraceae bacterium]